MAHTQFLRDYSPIGQPTNIIHAQCLSTDRMLHNLANRVRGNRSYHGRLGPMTGEIYKYTVESHECKVFGERKRKKKEEKKGKRGGQRFGECFFPMKRCAITTEENKGRTRMGWMRLFRLLRSLLVSEIRLCGQMFFQ